MNTNCQNCGATLSFNVVRDHLNCTYCNTVHVPLLRENLGVELASNIASESDCPVCKKSLAHGKIQQWKLLLCADCRGLLVSRGDLLNLIVYRRQQSDVSDRKPDPIDPEHLKRRIDCPRCDVQMQTMPYFGPGDFVIDSCGRCDQIWLDGGELDRSSTIRWGGSVWR